VTRLLHKLNEKPHTWSEYSSHISDKLEQISTYFNTAAFALHSPECGQVHTENLFLTSIIQQSKKLSTSCRKPIIEPSLASPDYIEQASPDYGLKVLDLSFSPQYAALDLPCETSCHAGPKA